MKRGHSWRSSEERVLNIPRFISTKIVFFISYICIHTIHWKGFKYSTSFEGTSYHGRYEGIFLQDDYYQCRDSYYTSTRSWCLDWHDGHQSAPTRSLEWVETKVWLRKGGRGRKDNVLSTWNPRIPECELVGLDAACLSKLRRINWFSSVNWRELDH